MATGNGDLDDVTSTDAPDQVLYRSAPFTKPTAIAGPLVATLWASLTAPDAEFYVRVATEAPDGSLSVHNRGYLKASHRAVDNERSFFDGDVMYRPWHPHTATTTALVTPGKPTRLDIEVWPIETVVRPGHRLVMFVSAPATQDLFDTYQTRTAPQPVRILRDAKSPDQPARAGGADSQRPRARDRLRQADRGALLPRQPCPQPRACPVIGMRTLLAAAALAAPSRPPPGPPGPPWSTAASS